jgi:hypothetical protein
MNTSTSTENPPDIQESESESVKKYIEQLNDKERIAYSIAKEHLATSFNIAKSIGYLTWKKNQPK